MGLTVQKRSFHRSIFVNSSNQVTGTIWNTFSGLSHYFSLDRTNKLLVDENVKLKGLLQVQKAALRKQLVDSVYNPKLQQRYTFRAAKVIHNSFKNRNNYLTLDIGAKQGVEEGSAVVGPDGVVGIVDQVTSNYSSVISMLNERSRISARLNKSRYFGSIVWDGKDHTKAALLDIPREAVINIGDSLSTNSYSSIFPEGMAIGRVSTFKLRPEDNFYDVEVELATDFANLSYVYVIQNLLKGELDSLEAGRNEQ